MYARRGMVTVHFDQAQHYPDSNGKFTCKASTISKMMANYAKHTQLVAS